MSERRSLSTERAFLAGKFDAAFISLHAPFLMASIIGEAPVADVPALPSHLAEVKHAIDSASLDEIGVEARTRRCCYGNRDQVYSTATGSV